MIGRIIAVEFVLDRHNLTELVNDHLDSEAVFEDVEPDVRDIDEFDLEWDGMAVTISGDIKVSHTVYPDGLEQTFRRYLETDVSYGDIDPPGLCSMFKEQYTEDTQVHYLYRDETAKLIGPDQGSRLRYEEFAPQRQELADLRTEARGNKLLLAQIKRLAEDQPNMVTIGDFSRFVASVRELLDEWSSED
jgi:hypothetical protein